MWHVSRTHRVAIDWLLDRINLDQRFNSNMLTPNTDSQTNWQKDTSHVTNGIIFFVCSTLAISALLAAPRISACLASSPKRMAKRMQEQKGEKRSLQNRILHRWTCLHMFRQVPHPREVRLRREPHGYSKLQVDRLNYQGGLMQAQITIPIPTQRRVLKVGKEMLNCSSAQGNLCGNGKGSEVSEPVGRICHQHRETCGNWIPRMFRKSQNSRRFRRIHTQMSNLATSFPCITRLWITWRKSSRS